MSILVVGLSHHTASVDLLERAVVGTADRPALIQDLLAGANVGEVVVLSTCNRVELYAAVSSFHGGLHDVGSVLAGRLGVDVADLAESLYVHYADDAVQHLFEAVGGLDSMVVGESQILGQIRTAYNAAAELGAPGRLLHELMQQALRVGKRVHTETGIDRAGQSVVSLALKVGAAATRPLEGASALVIGAGSMGALVAATLSRSGVQSLTVANRSGIRAARLARSQDEDAVPIQVVRFDELGTALKQADIVVSATASTATVLTVETLGDARPQLIIDLAVPRDVDPRVGELDGVHLIDIASLGSQAHSDAVAVQDEVTAARAIVVEEVAAFLAWQRTVDVTPTVAALRARADEVVVSELARLASRMPDLDERTRSEVERSVRRVVATLLHVPTVRVKELASSPNGQAYANALRELFGLDTAAASAPAVFSANEAVAPVFTQRPKATTDGEA
ncbi:glutamyl-tRNA reductase [Fodinicola feengrottensis]|uniref:Glutamyl-tRNA reductase n=1 Tax=Fodinicola feengrottensis TaxID=435914 RepID=A0ABN2FPV9_9ACTN|nr:glutamyl-tRNA reductase [Fodinicola feengrottensis]